MRNSITYTLHQIDMHEWEDNIKMILNKSSVSCGLYSGNGPLLGFCERDGEPSCSYNVTNCLISWVAISFSTRNELLPAIHIFLVVGWGRRWSSYGTGCSAYCRMPSVVNWSQDTWLWLYIIAARVGRLPAPAPAARSRFCLPHYWVLVCVCGLHARCTCNSLQIIFSVFRSSQTVWLSMLHCWSERHKRRRPSFGRFCTSAATCPHEPLSFRELVYEVLGYSRWSIRQKRGTSCSSVL